MNRYLFRVQYAYPDETVSYEPVVVRAEDETDARVQVADASERYRAAVGATRSLTLVLMTVGA